MTGPGGAGGPVVSVVDAVDDHRYEVLLNGAPAGFAAYRDSRAGSVRTFTHTELDPAFEGRGLGSALVRGALDDVRARGLRIVARCPFVAGYVDRHPEYADLIAG